MEQVTPTYPGIIGSDQCANCSRLVSDLEAARIDLRLATGFNEQYVKQLDAAHEQIETLQQLVNEQSETIRQLREQRDCNKDLRMDRGIYRADGFDTGSGD